MYIDLYVLQYLPESAMKEGQVPVDSVLFDMEGIDLSDNWYSPLFTLHQTGLLYVSEDHPLIERLEPMPQDSRWSALLEHIYHQSKSTYANVMRVLGTEPQYMDNTEEMLNGLYRAIADMLQRNPDPMKLETADKLVFALWEMSTFYPFTNRTSSFDVWPYICLSPHRLTDLAVSVYKMHI